VIRIRGQNTFIVNLPKPLARDEILTLRVMYSGRIPPQPPDREVAGAGQREGQMFDMPLLVPEPRYVFSNRSYWYPQGTVTDYATARLRLTVPVPFVSVATGSPAAENPVVVRASSPTDVDRNVSEFVAGQPVRYLSWAISRFEPAATASVALPSLNGTTAGSSNGHEAEGFGGWGVRYDSLDLAVTANPRQVGRGRTLTGQVEGILEFYAGLVGDLPYPSFTLALVDNDLPGGHSPAYFALLYQPLPTTPFLWRNDPVYFDSFPQFFTAHELAHQYWGQAVGWKSYHEQWISEGFAQYFAALYAEKLGATTVFPEIIRRMRRTVLDNEQQGPIWLGYRLGHIRADSRVFRSIIYNKGAMVLHMLRRLVGDEPFFRGLRMLYRGSRFTKIGTDDVRQVFEEATGRPLARFFERWVYESTIPRVRWSWRLDTGGTSTAAGTAADGATPAAGWVRVRFEEAGLSSEPFDLPVTVTLAYTDGSSEDVVVAIDDRAVEARLPLKGRVRAVDVNADGAALARFDRQ
jgi:hypothetical protein